MLAPRFLESFEQYLGTGGEEKNFNPFPPFLIHFCKLCAYLLHGGAAAHIKTECNLIARRFAMNHKMKKRREQRCRQIINTREPHILKRAQHAAFASSRIPGDDNNACSISCIFSCLI